MRRWKLKILLPLLFLSGPALEPVRGQDPASELRRLSTAINEAKTKVRFEAELTSYAFSEKETKVTRFRLKYAYPYKKKECIEEGSENPRFIVQEDGKHLWSYFPARNLVVKEPLRKWDSPFPLNPTKDLNLLMENYEIVIHGPVPAGGGMRCRIVEFIPRWGDRPNREFWLEERWNLPVRVRVTSSDGRPVYMAELSQIHLDPGLDEEDLGLRVPQGTKVYEIQEKENLTIEEAERLLDYSIVLPRGIPAGYSPRNIVVRAEGAKQCLQIIYTDGLSSFSYFQRGAPSPIGRDASVLSARRYGLMNVVEFPGSGPKAVLVGDLHRDRMMKMAESLAESIGNSFGRIPP